MAQHARHGASASEIWIHCAGALAAMGMTPNEDTVYTITGTAAHDVAAQVLRDNRDPLEFLDRYIEVPTTMIVAGKPHIERIHVDEEMVNAVDMYRQLYFELTGLGFADVITFIEHRVSLNELAVGFPEPLFGTCDLGIYDKATRRLIVADFKYGQGVVVEAKDNSQGRYYALGLLLDPLLRGQLIETVEIYICQPRTENPIRKETLSVDELMTWADEVLLPAAWRTLEEGAKRTPGAHCRWCRFVDCPERREQEFREVAILFDERVMPLPGAAPPDVDLLTGDDMARLLDVSDRVLAFFKGLRERAFRDLNADPHSIPGWKIVGKKGHRRWLADMPEETAMRLQFEWALPDEALWKKKLKSPNQIVEAIKLQFPKRGRDPRAKELVIKLHDLYETPITNTTLARENDEREAVLGTDIIGFERVSFQED